VNDMSAVIVPKSDQINADDFIAGPRTITVTAVSIRPGTEQPVSISYEGDGNKPFKPSKGMCRIMVALWGPDANAYVGRSMTLYRDPGVKWGGLEVGGIRISHMSHIEGPHTLALTLTKGNKKPHTVKPLVVEQKADKPAEGTRALVARIEAVADMGALQALTGAEAVIKQRSWLTRNRPELAHDVDQAVLAALERLDPPEPGSFDADQEAGTAGPRDG
jgi:hypothetical protein